jgi:cell wall-associated NlpC family hydrolase
VLTSSSTRTALVARASTALTRTDVLEQGLDGHEQQAGDPATDGQPLLPGDLVFYGNLNTKIRHVGLYIGRGLMINAPDFGQRVTIQPHAHKDYAGATRPASHGCS